MNDILVPESIVRDIAAAEEDYCRRVRKCDPMAAARSISSSYRENYARLRELVGDEGLAESRILEVGSGNGFLLSYARRQGVDMVGVEPGKGFGFEGRHGTAAKLLECNGISPDGVIFDAPAENLPFEDGSFDLVFSIAVLEHVGDMGRVMQESLRVLKPGGMLWANVPNYRSWHEDHYDVFWLPFLGKKSARHFVKHLYGRDPSFVDTLNFTSPSDFKEYLDGDASCGTLHLRGGGLAGYLFEAHRLVRGDSRSREAGGGGRLKGMLLSLASGKGALLVRWPLGLLSAVLETAGLAPVFDVVLHKRGGA